MRATERGLGRMYSSIDDQNKLSRSTGKHTRDSYSKHNTGQKPSEVTSPWMQH